MNPRYLYIGSGAGSSSHRLFEGYDEIRVDIDPNVTPAIVADCTALPLADASVEGVLTCHMLEHLHPNKLAVCMAESFRVLTEDGFCVAAVPDFELACHVVAAGDPDTIVYDVPGGPISALDMIYGWRLLSNDNDFMTHRNGFTTKTLRAAFEGAGFVDVEVARRRHMCDLHAIGRKPIQETL